MLVFNVEDLGGTSIHLDSSRKRARERESRGG